MTSFGNFRAFPLLWTRAELTRGTGPLHFVGNVEFPFLLNIAYSRLSWSTRSRQRNSMMGRRFPLYVTYLPLYDRWLIIV